MKKTDVKLPQPYQGCEVIHLFEQPFEGEMTKWMTIKVSSKEFKTFPYKVKTQNPALKGPNKGR